MPIRAKNHKTEAAAAAFKKVAIAGTLAAAAYGGSVVYYNSGSPAGGADANGIEYILSRSRYDFIEQASHAAGSPRLTISAIDVYKVEDANTIDFYSDVGNDFIVAFNSTASAANEWNISVRRILEKSAAPRENKFTFTFEKKDSGDDTAIKTAKQYQIGIVPGETAAAWPKLELRQNSNGYYGTLSIAKGWEENANVGALRAFMTEIAQQAEKSKTARRETGTDISGTYHLERGEDGTLSVYKDGAAPAADVTAKTGTLAAAMRTAVTQYRLSGNTDPQDIVLTWSRLNYMEQLMDAKSAQLSASIKDVYQAGTDKGVNMVSFYQSAALKEFMTNYNAARAVADKWNLMVARIATNVGADQKGYITTGSFYRLGIVPAAPGATEAEMTLTANRNGVYYAVMSLPVTWDDKTGANALRAFMEKLQQDTAAAKVTAGAYKLVPDHASSLFKAYRAEAQPPALSAPKL